MLHTRIATFTLALAAGALAVAAVRPALLSQQMMQPTEEHKQLLAGVGVWKGTLTSFMMPDAPAEPVAATETIEAIGSFWTQSRFECQFMGMPYVGAGCLGYDTTKKKFVGTWIDNMGPHFALMEGEVDPKTKALVMRWEGPDMTGKMTPHRMEVVHAQDSYTSTFYMGEGAGTKSMVIAMKRVPKTPVPAGAAK